MGMITKLDERTNILEDICAIKEWLDKLSTSDDSCNCISADRIKYSDIDKDIKRNITDFEIIQTDTGYDITITESVCDGDGSKKELEKLSDSGAFKDQIAICELIYQFCCKYTVHLFRRFCSAPSSYEINYSKIEKCVDDIPDKDHLQKLVSDTIEKGGSYTCLNFNILSQLANIYCQKEKERKLSNLPDDDLLNNVELKEIELRLAVNNKRIYQNHFPIVKEICKSILLYINVWFERDKVFYLSNAKEIENIFDDYAPNTFIDCINLIPDVQLKVKNRCAQLMFALVYLLEKTLDNDNPPKKGEVWVKRLFKENHIVWDGNNAQKRTGAERYEQYKNKKSEYLNYEKGQLVLKNNANQKIKFLYQTVKNCLEKSNKK